MAKTSFGHERLTARTLRRNVTWNYTAGLASIVGLILLFPLAVQISGTVDYGFWVVCFSAVQLFAIADFGLGTGIVRMLGKMIGDGRDEKELKSFVSVSLWIFLILAIALATMFVLFFSIFVDGSMLALPSSLARDAPILVGIAALTLLIAVFGRATNAILWAENRLDIERKATTVGLGVRASGLVLLLWLGGGIVGVAAVEAVAISLPTLATAAFSLRIYRWSRVPIKVARSHAILLAKFSAVLFLGTFSAMLLSQLPVYILGGQMQLIAVTGFGALLRVSQSTRMATTWLTNPFSAEVATADEDPAASARLYRRVTILTSLFSTAIAIPLIAFPDSLMEIWMGRDFLFTAPGLALIGVGTLANGVILTAGLFGNMLGHPAMISLLNLAALVLGIPAIYFGFLWWGFIGAVAGVVAPLIVLAPAFWVVGLRTARAKVEPRGVLYAGALVMAAVAMSASLIAINIVARSTSPWIPVGSYVAELAVLGAGYLGVKWLANSRTRRTVSPQT